MRIEGYVRLEDTDNEATYLGVKMDTNLTWGSNIESNRHRARATRAKKYPMTSRTSKVALRNTETLIKL